MFTVKPLPAERKAQAKVGDFIAPVRMSWEGGLLV